jgi:chromosome condensin MukBEF ATPase and DNA-binding subunit MukB
MDRYIKVEGNSNLVRDLKTNAILNTDTQSLNQYIALKNKKNKEREKINTLSNDIEELKSSMEEIKSLLKGIINGP